jgi:hypothetical protein
MQMSESIKGDLTERCGSVPQAPLPTQSADRYAEVRRMKREIDQERRDMMTELSLRQTERKKAMWALCGSIGHFWRFTHFGPTGAAWYSCGYCWLARNEPERESEAAVQNQEQQREPIAHSEKDRET